MKPRILILPLAIAGLAIGWNTPAHAVGCISGGIAGAVAGHMMHHGVLGAVGGCVAGHEYNKHHQTNETSSQTGEPYPPIKNGTQPDHN